MRAVHFVFYVVLCTVLWCSTATGAIISGTHQLSNGKYVDLGGLEWLDLQSTVDAPRESVLGPTYDGHSDWRFATRQETENLLDSLWGGVAEQWHDTNFAGADWFRHNLGVSDAAAGGIQYAAYFFYGSDADVAAVPGTGNSLSGQIYVNYHSDVFPNNQGWFTDASGLSTGVTPDNQVVKTDGFYPLTSHLLVRDATVPVPAPIVLLASGIAGLGLVRRSRKRFKK